MPVFAAPILVVDVAWDALDSTLRAVRGVADDGRLLSAAADLVMVFVIFMLLVVELVDWVVVEGRGADLIEWAAVMECCLAPASRVDDRGGGEGGGGAPAVAGQATTGGHAAPTSTAAVAGRGEAEAMLPSPPSPPSPPSVWASSSPNWQAC